MSIHNRITLGAAIALMALFLAACGNQQAAQTEASGKSTETAAAGNAFPGNLKITAWGPESTKAGEVFNKQPDGSAALWVRLDHSVEGDVAWVTFNGTRLPSAISGNLVTAKVVPADLYAKTGNFKVNVVASRGNRSAQSNDVTFAVH